MSSKIGEEILAELRGRRGLEEAMPNWKPISSEKSRLKSGFDQLQKDLKTVEFKDEGMRKGVLDNIRSAWKGVSNPGWGGVIGDLENAMEYEIEGRDLRRREDTATYEVYLDLMEVLVGLTERLARKDGSYFIYRELKDKLDEMRQRGLSQADVSDNYFSIEYPWTDKFDRTQTSRLFRAAQSGFAEGLGIANDALLKMKKGLKP